MFQFKAIRNEKPFLKFRLEAHLCLVLDSRKITGSKDFQWILQFGSIPFLFPIVAILSSWEIINTSMILLLLTVIYIYQPRSQALLSFSTFSREEERRPWKRGFKHNSVLSQMLQSVSAAVRHHCDRQLWVCSRNEIKTVAFPFQFWTTSRIILKRLDYFLSVSKRSIRANYVSLGRNLDLTA